jgi:hypothetical protein
MKQGLRNQRNLLYGNIFIYEIGDFNLREAQINTVAYKICRAAKNAFGKYEYIQPTWTGVLFSVIVHWEGKGKVTLPRRHPFMIHTGAGVKTQRISHLDTKLKQGRGSLRTGGFTSEEGASGSN